MALSELTFSDSTVMTLVAKLAATTSDHAKPSFSLTILKPQVTVSKTIANATAGGGDQAYSGLLSIAGSGNASLDLQSFTNIAGETTCSFARVKYVKIRLLSTEDDSTNGTACSGIEVKPHATNGWTGLFKDATDTITLGNGDDITWKTKRAAGIVVDATHKVLYFTNLDASVTAKVQVTVIGGTS